jgi:type I restriction enzyme S subunit
MNALNSLTDLLATRAELDRTLANKLQKSILQEAIQGKLVPQDPTDEPAEELLKRIRKEKEKLVAEGKLKCKDVVESNIFKGDDNKYYEQIGNNCVEISNEIPFDIPEKWLWCRLSQCCIRIFSGKSPSYSKIPTKHIIIGQQANQWEHIEIQYVKYGTDAYAQNIDEYQYLLDGDVLLNTLGNGTLGRCGIFENISDKVLSDGHLFIIRTIEKVLAKYILFYLTLNYAEINRKADGSTNQTFLNLKKVSNYLIPLPPLNEIGRIVQKKEELYSRL